MNRDTIKRGTAKIKGEHIEGPNLNSVPAAIMERRPTMTMKAFVPADTRISTDQPSASSNAEARGTANSLKNIPALNHAENMQSNALSQNHPVMLSSPGVHNGDDQLAQMDGEELYASSPANLDRSKNGNNRKRLVDYEESDEEDEGGPIRNSEGRSRAKRQKQESDTRIGHHRAEPLLPIFAKFKKSSSGHQISHIYSRPMHGAFPSGQTWRDYVHKNGQVNLEDVIMDPDLFPSCKDSSEAISPDQKRDMIKHYLLSIIKEDPEVPSVENDEPASPTKQKYKQVPAFVVGYHRDDLVMPVYAHLRIPATNFPTSLLFRLDKEDFPKSRIEFSGISVSFPKIKFLPEFGRSTEKETKAEIMIRFLANGNANDDEEVVSTQSQLPPPSRTTSDRTQRRSRARSGTGTFAHRLNIALPNGTADGIDESLEALQASGQTYLTAAFNYGQKLKNRESVVLEKEVSLLEREADVESREQVIADEISAGVQAGLTSEKDVVQSVLHNRWQQLPSPDLSIRQSCSDLKLALPRPQRQDFFGAYQKIPEQSPNAGWYFEAQSQITVLNDGPLGGKKFSQNQILQPIQGIAVPGRPKDTAVRCDGVEYLHYEEDGVSKLVRSSESVVQHEGQYYVRWTYLREMKEPSFTF
ncbi:hypothetical protein VTL71DRAFT_15143 [Oculimacula yallundae]|uniref:Uncharacterized protein n=1 Tax=Oculimacula yallundae TaxID=86028 RepID=A0ABR4CFR1_9HELO